MFSPTSVATHLRADGLSHSYGGHRVLTNISLTVATGQRVGLIGENGSGKSTLLRILAGQLKPTGGIVSVTAPGHIERTARPRVGLLNQTPPFSPEETVAHSLESAVAVARQAAQDVETLSAQLAQQPENAQILADYGAALERAEHYDAWDTDARIASMLAGLGLDELGLNRLGQGTPTGQLSGGQRSRLALAWLLLNEPDVLVLDEPTNHLDDVATDYLVDTLAGWRGPVIFASHDRAFLDRAANVLMDLDPSPVPHSVSAPLLQDGVGTGIGLTRFSGTFSDYLQARADAMRHWEQQYAQEQEQLKQLSAGVQKHQTVGHPDFTPRSEVRMAQKFYADRNAKTVSRRVKDARNRLERLKAEQIRKPPRPLVFQGLISSEQATLPSASTESVLTLAEASVQDRLTEASLSISRGEKWLITGANGSGKTTLLALMAGTLEPTNGTVWRCGAVRWGLLEQEVHIPDAHSRGEDRTVAQAFEDAVTPAVAERVPLASMGLVAGRDINRPVNALSTGQQQRLALAILIADPPNILLLDEPTNHLSLDLVTRLEASLAEYPGTVVVASHDRWLRERWEGRNLEL